MNIDIDLIGGDEYVHRVDIIFTDSLELIDVDESE